MSSLLRPVVVIVAFLLLVFGAGFLGSSLAPNVISRAFSLPAGSVYADIFFTYVNAARVSLTYTVTTGGRVDVYLLTDAQFATYRSGGGIAALDSSDSGGGTLTYDVPSGGTYHFLFLHAAGFESVGEDLSTTVLLDGVPAVPFYLGQALMAVGAVLLVVWVRMFRVGRPLPRSPREAALRRGVTYFRDPKAPPPAAPPGPPP